MHEGMHPDNDWLDLTPCLVEVATDAALHRISRVHEQSGLEREGVNS